MANNSLLTVARERRMFKNVLKFFGAQRPVSSVKIASLVDILITGSRPVK
jgi:hypothetical protein